MKKTFIPGAFISILLMCLGFSVISNSAEETDGDNDFAAFQAPLLLYQDRLLTTVVLNGKDQHFFLIDNGCRFSLIDPRIIGEKSFEPEQTIRINALNRGKREVQLGNIRRLSIGDLDLFSSRVVAAPEVCRSLRKAMRRNVCGIIGYETLRRYRVTFDFSRKRILLYQGGSDILQTPHECLHADSLPLKNSKVYGGVSDEHWRIVDININGTVVPAVVDFGFPGTLLTTVYHRRLRLEANSSCKKTAVQLLGKALSGRISTADSIEIGRQRFKRVNVICINDPGLPEITLIGTRLLQRFRLTLDFQGRRMLLSPHDDRCADE